MVQINKSFTDQMGREVRIKSPPKRIISLVPSQTELLYDLGLDQEVVGITKFCIHPKEWYKSKLRVGGTKKLNFEKIKELHPDLIIGNKEENNESQIKELMKDHSVWMSDIKTLNDAYKMILSVGEIVDKREKSEELVGKIKREFKSLKVDKVRRNVLYFIWREPYMVVGKDTFIDHILNLSGFEASTPTALELQSGGRYLEVTADQIRQINPDVIFLSSEPFPFNEKHIAEFQSICPNATIKLVDGELFSWYGSRLLKTPAYLKGLIDQLSSI